MAPPAATSETQQQSSPSAPQQGGLFGESYIPLLMIVVFFGVIYFTIMRPQKKEEKRKKDMLETLQKGDSVVTTSGMIGTVASIKDDVVMLKIGDGVRVEFLKSAVSAVRKTSSPAKSEASGKS